MRLILGIILLTGCAVSGDSPEFRAAPEQCDQSLSLDLNRYNGVWRVTIAIGHKNCVGSGMVWIEDPLTCGTLADAIRDSCEEIKG